VVGSLTGMRFPVFLAQMFSPGYLDRPWIVKKLRSVWKPASMVSFLSYLTRSDAVGARRWDLFVHQRAEDGTNKKKNAHPYLPASEKVLVGIPRPVAIMSATSSTLEYCQMIDDHWTTDYKGLTHSSLTGPIVA